jgi:hypothetical protein
LRESRLFHGTDRVGGRRDRSPCGRDLNSTQLNDSP